MARNMAIAVHGTTAFTLARTTFENIIFLDVTDLKRGPSVRLLLNQSTGLITISSKTETTAWNSNANMTLELRTASSTKYIGAAELRARCPDHVGGDAFYAATANDYRGEFRGMAEAWGGNGCDSLAHIAYPSLSTKDIHLRTCAWLDATTHAPIWWTDHQRRSFYIASVSGYHVDSTDVSANKQIWSWVARDEDKGVQDSSICGSAFDCIVRIEGSRGGVWDPSLLEERRARSHTYQIQWKPIAPDHPTQQPLVAVSIGDAPEIEGRPATCPSNFDGSAKPMLLGLSRHLNPLPVLMAVVHLLQSCAPSPPAGGVWVVTQRTQGTRLAESVQPNHAGPWGFSRCARSEVPQLGARCADLGPGALNARQSISKGAAARCIGLSEPEVAHRG
jgi:hypothetical protein